MLRKKTELAQTNNLIKPRETSKILQNRNAKVKVQYIKEQQQLIKKPDNPTNHMIHHTASQDDLEIENVEYLEENPTSEEFTEEPNEKYDFDDTFYPNAIHCLLDLYKVKYESLCIDERGNLMLAELWQDIAKDMQESYFEFNEQQVRQKYILLREQYFGLHSREDIENFDYFEQLHDIYKDCGKENILKGMEDGDNNSTHKDEFLFTQMKACDAHCHDFKSEEIVHKEHEFIDMVEKELQAIDEGKLLEEPNEIFNMNKIDNHPIVKKEVTEDGLEEKRTTLKRVFSTDEIIKEPPKRKKSREYIEIKEITHSSANDLISTANNEFSLFKYNEQQERRHREKMNLLEKSLKLQERAIEQQNQLLQELVKRLPS